MRFTVGSDVYVLEFSRSYKQIHSGYDKDKKEDLFQPSKFPYTTVIIWKDKAGAIPGELWREATVGAYRNEQYTHEKGRLHALRLVGKSLTKEFRGAMWKAYMQRDVKPKARG